MPGCLGLYPVVAENTFATLAPAHFITVCRDMERTGHHAVPATKTQVSVIKDRAFFVFVYACTGHAEAHPGSLQWLHWTLRYNGLAFVLWIFVLIDHSICLFSRSPFSLKTEASSKDTSGGGRLFASLQAFFTAPAAHACSQIGEAAIAVLRRGKIHTGGCITAVSQ